MPTDRRELYGQLLPLHGVAMILPKIAVLEIQGMDGVRLATDGPAWLLGFGAWRERDLPVVSLEAMAGAGLPARTRRSRVAVLNSLGTSLETGLFMIVTQGYPQLTALNAAALQRIPDVDRDAEVALSRVRLANTEAIIPDLESIESRIQEAVARMAPAAADDGWQWQPGNATFGAQSGADVDEAAPRAGERP